MANVQLQGKLSDKKNKIWRRPKRHAVHEIVCTKCGEVFTKLVEKRSIFGKKIKWTVKDKICTRCSRKWREIPLTKK